MRFSTLFLFLFLFSFFSCKEENPKPITTEPDPCLLTQDEEYSSCVREKDSTSLEIATWNIKQFPATNNTVEALEELITNFHADVIAVQEITSESDFEELDELLPTWEAELFVSSGLNIGFLYNTCEINSVSDLEVINIGDNYAFPRKPVKMTVTHENGLEVTLINIHLKCCDNGIERRAAASALLKDYIDNNYPNENLILIGDFNDDIENTNSPFNNFIQDDANYMFTDMEIALGPEEDFSFPSWPSHIDHILVTNELFDNVDYTETVKFQPCFSTYENLISDHRPVLISLTAEE